MREVCNAEWDDIQDRLKEKDAKIRRLEALCARAADALESNQIATSTSCEIFTLIAELRKAAK